MPTTTGQRPPVWPFVALDSATVTATDRGSAIRRARKEQRSSIEDLAAATGVSPRTIGRIERGEVKNAHSLQVLEEHLKPELDRIAARDRAGQPATAGTDDPPLSQASYMQTVNHLVGLHAALTAELADAIRLGQFTDPDEVREWRTEDAPSTNRVRGEQPPHDAGANQG